MAAGGGRELRRSLGDLNVCKNNCCYVSALALLILCRQNGLRVDNLTDISPLNLYYSSWNLYFYWRKFETFKSAFKIVRYNKGIDRYPEMF